MTPVSRTICGIILLTVPTIQYGGYFLLTILSGQASLSLTDFQKAMFRAGHAHAGVLVILSLLAQLLADYVNLPQPLVLPLRIGFPLAAILVSGGFFAGAAGPGTTQPNSFIWILYTGALVLALSVITLGIGLLRK
jgi:hypothetical protein